MYLIWAKLLHSSALFGSFLPAPGENGRKCLGRDALHGDHQHGGILEPLEIIGTWCPGALQRERNHRENHRKSGKNHRKSGKNP